MIKKRVAVLMLAYADYEAMEISLATFSKSFKGGIKFFILQNGRNTYDCERTYRVAKRYEILFPNNVKVVDWIKPQLPYSAIKELLNSEFMAEFDYICKVDDDVFALREDWLDKLIKCYDQSEEKFGEQLGYVTALVNNNPWGFNEVLDIFNLKEEYFNKYARPHLAGYILNPNDNIEPLKLISANEIYTGCCGTVWGNPYISRWLHKKTSFNPQEFIQKTDALGYKEVDNKRRYSINVMLFKKEFWNNIDLNSNDDEHMTREYCRNNNKKIIADMSNPFVHICFFTQREENRDLLVDFRKIYENWLNLPFPISMCPNKDYENENRLRYLEDKYCKQLVLQNNKKAKWKRYFNIKNSEDRKFKLVTLFGKIYKLKRK